MAFVNLLLFVAEIWTVADDYCLDCVLLRHRLLRWVYRFMKQFLYLLLKWLLYLPTEWLLRYKRLKECSHGPNGGDSALVEDPVLKAALLVSYEAKSFHVEINKGIHSTAISFQSPSSHNGQVLGLCYFLCQK